MFVIVKIISIVILAISVAVHLSANITDINNIDAASIRAHVGLVACEVLCF